MPQTIHGPSAVALNSLSATEVAFLRSLPKAELHAHLNGCIPLSCLQHLAQTAASGLDDTVSADVRDGLEKLRNGVELSAIGDFFGLFSAIYALTSTPDALARATSAVLESFLDEGERQCDYLELRTTPRQTAAMSRLRYLETVLDEVEKYAVERAALIVSIDRRMADGVVRECVDLAIGLKSKGRRVVGVDLCGDPLAGDMQLFAAHFRRVKEAGLGITLHIAETVANSAEETLQLLAFEPDRLGHATFLNNEARKVAFERKVCVEICLTSNLMCKTVPSLQDHHVRYHFDNDHALVICTDDTLPFRNSLLGEYALLVAKPPLGLGLTQAEVSRIAKMSMDNRFTLCK